MREAVSRTERVSTHELRYKGQTCCISPGAELRASTRREDYHLLYLIDAQNAGKIAIGGGGVIEGDGGGPIIGGWLC